MTKMIITTGAATQAEPSIMDQSTNDPSPKKASEIALERLNRLMAANSEAKARSEVI